MKLQIMAILPWLAGGAIILVQIVYFVLNQLTNEIFTTVCGVWIFIMGLSF